MQDDVFVLQKRMMGKSRRLNVDSPLLSSCGKSLVSIIEGLAFTPPGQDSTGRGFDPRLQPPTSNLQPPTGLSRTLYSVPCTCSLYTNARVARSFSRGARWGKKHLCKSAYNLTGGLHPRHRTSLCECDVLLGPVADIVILLMLCNAVQLLLLPATPPIRLSSSSRPFSQDLLAPTHFFSSSELSTATHSSARSVLTGS